MNPIPIYQAIILGIVQGITEPLPISSTGHLRLVPRIFGWNDAGLAFDVALHLGTLIAVVIYFWRDWIELTRPVINKLRKIESVASPHFGQNLFWGIVVGCIPAGIVGAILNDTIDGIETDPTKNTMVMIVVASALIVVGFVLYLCDKYGTKHKKKLAEMNFFDWIIIGTAQAVALIPGVSRSGATISAGLARGMDRDTAARFSFLLSAPIVFAGVCKHVIELYEKGMTRAEIAPFAVGMITSAIVGFAAIKFLLGFVRKNSYIGFVWYRFALGAVILAVVIAR